jgi:peptidyl-prolyl cis-trans isomerase C
MMNPAPVPTVLSALLAVAISAIGCRDADVVATVGKTDIRRRDVDLWNGQRRAHPDLGSPKALDALIDNVLLAEQARRQGLEKDPLVRARLAAAEREILAHALTDRELAKATDDEALRKRYAQKQAGFTRRQLRLRQIMVQLAPGASTADKNGAHSRMNVIYGRVLSNEPFEKVARESSEDAGSAKRGGDLGIVREGQVDDRFFAKAAALKPNEVSKPFETPFGVHIVQCISAVEAMVQPFDEVRGLLAAQARHEAEAQLLERLQHEISVRRFDPPPAARDADGARVR